MANILAFHLQTDDPEPGGREANQVLMASVVKLQVGWLRNNKKRHNRAKKTIANPEYSIVARMVRLRGSSDFVFLSQAWVAKICPKQSMAAKIRIIPAKEEKKWPLRSLIEEGHASLEV